MLFCSLRYLLICFLSFLALPLFAQTGMTENTEKENFLIKYNITNNIYLNDILNRLAQSNGKALNTVELTISLEKYVRVALEGRAGINYETKIQLKPLEIKGETSYRGFDISNFLVPSVYSFEVQKDVGSTETVLKVFSNSPANDQGVFSTFVPFIESSAELSKIKIKLQKLSIGYDAKAKEHFDFITKLVDAYYEQKIGMTELRQKIQNLNFNDPSRLENNQRELVFLERQVQNLQRFSQDLDLNSYDPINFLGEYALLQQFLNDKKSALESVKQNAHEVYYQQAMTQLNNGNDNAATQLFQKAIQQKENFALAHFQLARIAYMNGDFEAAERKLDYTRRNTDVDYQAEGFINDLYSDLCSYHINKGGKEFRDLEFDKSMKEYERASEICEKIYGYRNCKEEIREKITQTASGKLEYIVMQVREEIFAENLSTASVMLGEAKDYLNQNKQNIPDYTILLEVYKEFFDGAMARAEAQKNKKQYKLALDDLSIAAQVCAQNMLQEKCDDRVLKMISVVKIAQYNEILDKASQSISSYDFKAAEQQLKAAKEFREGNEEEVKDVSRYSKLLQDCYTAQIALADKKIQSKNFQEATQILAEAESFDSQHEEVKAAPNLQNTIYAANEGQYNTLLATATQKRKTGQTQAAADALLAAEEFLQKNNSKLRSAKLNAVGNENTLIYEDLLLNAAKQVANKSFSDALKVLGQASQIKEVQIRDESNVRFQRTTFQAHSGLAKQAQSAQDYNTEIEHLNMAKNAVSGKITATDFGKLGNEARDGMVTAYDKLIQKEIPVLQAQAKQTNTLSLAMSKVRSILELGKKNGIQPSASTAKSFKETESQIQQKYCERVTADIETKKTLAENQMKAKQFDLALKTTDEALALCQANPDCPADQKALEKLRSEHLDAADYQTMLTQAIVACKQNALSDAFSRYEKADLFFTERQLKARFGLLHLQMPEWLAQNGTVEFMQFSAAELCRRDLKASLQILNLIAARSNNSYDLLRAGELIAAKEFNASVKSKDVLAKYPMPKGDASKKFAQGFKSKWKSMGGK